VAGAFVLPPLRSAIAFREVIQAPHIAPSADTWFFRRVLRTKLGVYPVGLAQLAGSNFARSPFPIPFPVNATWAWGLIVADMCCVDCECSSCLSHNRGPSFQPQIGWLIAFFRNARLRRTCGHHSDAMCSGEDARFRSSALMRHRDGKPSKRPPYASSCWHSTLTTFAAYAAPRTSYHRWH